VTVGNFGGGAASLTSLCQSHKRTILASVTPAIGKGITQALRRAVRHSGAPLLTALTARPAIHPVRRISAETKTCAVVRPRNKLEIDGRQEPVPSQERAHWTIQRRSFVYKQSRLGVASVGARFTTEWRRGSSLRRYRLERVLSAGWNLKSTHGLQLESMQVGRLSRKEMQRLRKSKGALWHTEAE
jgi:hypothetical protein